LLYKFNPAMELETGWDARALDIRTGGLLYGDDHPFLGFRGDLAPQTSYELLYLPVQNMSSMTGDPFDSDEINDTKHRCTTTDLKPWVKWAGSSPHLK
jgi:hypothetical protein